jgi:uncharacterized protein involved in exopolysaccharide biosynthesis
MFRSDTTLDGVDDNSVQIADIWQIAKFRWRWLAAASIGCAMLALAYALLTPKLYTAAAEVLVDPRGRQIVANDINPSTASPDGGVAQVESQSQVLQSTSVLIDAIRKLDLTHDKEFGAEPDGFAGVLAQMTRAIGIGKPIATEEAREAVTLRNIRKKLGIKRADKALVIDVLVTSRDPEKAALIVNTIVDSYIKTQAAWLADTAMSASTSLSANLEEQRARVREAADAVAAYKASNDLQEANNLTVSDQALSERAAALSEARARTALQRARLGQIERGAPLDDTNEAMQSSTISGLRDQEAQLIQSQAQLRLELGPRHPSLRKVEAQLVDLRAAISRELQRLRDSTKRDLDRAVAYENELAASLAQLKAAKAGSDQAAVGLQELQRELDARRAVYTTFLQRSQETREQANVDSSNVRVISRALPPVDKAWPPTFILIAGAGATGLGLAFAFALMVEYFAPTLLSRSQLQLSSGATDLGTISLARGARNRAALVNSAANDPAIAAAVGRYASEGHSLLLLSGEEDAQERRTLARSMVLAAAARSMRVLLISADPASQPDRKGAGLAEVLAGASSLRAAAVWDARTGIAVLANGSGRTIVSHPSNHGAERLLDEARRYFHSIIVEGGFDDLSAHPDLVAAVDNSILVARIGHTRQTVVGSALQTLDAAGKQLSGTIAVTAQKAA